MKAVSQDMFISFLNEACKGGSLVFTDTVSGARTYSKEGKVIAKIDEKINYFIEVK